MDNRHRLVAAIGLSVLLIAALIASSAQRPSDEPESSRSKSKPSPAQPLGVGAVEPRVAAGYMLPEPLGIEGNYP